MMNKIQKERLNYIDAARGIGILMVIFGHLDFPYLSQWIYTCHMPLFFFLSGMVFSADKYSFSTFIKKKIKGIIVPYFALGLGIWIFFSIVYLCDHNPPDFVANAIASPLEMMIQFLIQRHYWTVWFLACLFFANLILFSEFKITKSKTPYLLGCSVLICICAFVYYRLGGDTLPWNIDTACVAQLFMCLGYLFRKNSKSINLFSIVVQKSVTGKKIILTSCFAVVNIVFMILGIKFGGTGLDMSVHIYGNELFTMLSALFGTLFVMSVSAFLSNLRPLTYLGQNTMLLFAWHSRIMIPAFNYLYLALGVFQNRDVLMQCIYCIVTAVGILAVLLPINYLIKKSKLKFILGQ